MVKHADAFEFSTLSENIDTPIIAVPSTIKDTEDFTLVFRWLGIKFGKAHITWSETETAFKGKVEIKATGVARLFDKQLRTINTKGIKKLNENGTTSYIATEHHSLVKRPKKQRSVDILYDETGNVTKVTVTPPDDRRWRPDVDQEQKDTAFDYLSGAVAFYLRSLEDKPQIRLSYYDGRRLTEGVFTKGKINKSDVKKWPDSKNAQKYIARRVLKGGYTNKERRKYYEGEPTIIALFKKNLSRFPFYVYADSKYGRITAERAKKKN